MKQTHKLMLAPIALCLLPLFAGCGGKTDDGTAAPASNTASTNKASDTATTTNAASDAGAITITSATMSLDKEGTQAATTFKPSDRTIYSTATLSGPGNGVKVKAVWIAVDADGEKNKQFLEKEMVAAGKIDTLNLFASLPRDWPTGTFKTEIYLDGKLAKSLPWEIK